jgi:succinyl-CoA synthetase beta subunit
VKVVNTPDEARVVAHNLIGHHLVTKQSGAEGQPINSVYLVQKLSIDREMYMSITLDRA